MHRNFRLQMIAFMAVGGLLGYGAACADLFRNPAASVMTERPTAERGPKPTFAKKLHAIQIDEQKPGGQKPASGKKPNIVYFLVDNLGYGELGCYGGGILRGTKTPRIDRFAKQGMRLQNFAPESQCTPSRSALMTGRFSIRSGNHTVMLSGSSGGPRSLGEDHSRYPDAFRLHLLYRRQMAHR